MFGFTFSTSLAAVGFLKQKSNTVCKYNLTEVHMYDNGLETIYCQKLTLSFRPSCCGMYHLLNNCCSISGVISPLSTSSGLIFKPIGMMQCPVLYHVCPISKGIATEVADICIRVSMLHRFIYFLTNFN